MHHFITPEWPAPRNVKSVCTTRLGGYSQSPFDSLNFGLHVEDQSEHVIQNRLFLKNTLNLQKDPFWLEQTHSNNCLYAEKSENNHADAAITNEINQPLVIMTADCLPIILTNRQGDEIAAIHAGWRGLVNGVITSTIAKLKNSPAEYMAWIGPGICAQCFEVGSDVYHEFTSQDAQTHVFFTKHNSRWLLDAAGVAKHILQTNGIQEIYNSYYCTLEKKDWFFSYRRDGQTGRMATLIWMEA